MRRLRCLVKINRAGGSDSGAAVQDLPGCVATGRALDMTMRRIEAAIDMHIKGLRADRRAVPKPRIRSVVPPRSSRRIDFFATVEVAAA